MKLRHLVPFGLLESQKPRHFREMIRTVWENRGNLRYAWRILRRGVCDGCSLGPYGLRDNVLDGIHLCLTRLKLLHLNTMKAFDPGRLPDIRELRSMSNEELHRLGRVPVPLHWDRKKTRFEAISWDDAFDRIGRAIRAERAAGTPERIGMFATSRGITNETYYLFRKLASLCGTNNVDLCSRLCHAVSVDALKEVLGVGAPTCSLSDLIGTDLVVILGSNLANNQPVTMKYLHYAKKEGARIVVVNPYREPGLERYWVPSVPSSALFGTQIIDEFYQVHIGGDIAFMKGVLKALLDNDAVDHEFIERSTAGFEDLRRELSSCTWSEIEEESGVSSSEIRRFAETYGGAKSAVFVYSMGLTQHEFGADNVRCVANLALARGMIGREKCGILPIRGHSGVQGGGECGVDPGKLPGAVPLDAKSAESFSRLWGHPVATTPGLRVGQMLEAAHRGSISLLYSVGGNLFETMPDRTYMADALSRVPLRIHQDIVLNSSTVMEGNEVIVLPSQTRYEQTGGGTSTNTERRIRFTPEIPGYRVGQARADWEILAEVGRRIFPDPGPFSFRTSQSIREEMGRVMPVYVGIEKLQHEGDQLQWGGPQLFSGGRFDQMPENRARFSIVPLPRLAIPKGFLYVTTRRGRQFNSMTFGSYDPLTDVHRKEIFVSHYDAKERGLNDGDRIRVTSETGSLEGVLRIAPIRPRNVQVHWPEGNVLISRRYDSTSEEPDYNALATLERIAP